MNQPDYEKCVCKYNDNQLGQRIGLRTPKGLNESQQLRMNFKKLREPEIGGISSTKTTLEDQ
jgi:hypothetical protein